MFGEMWYRVSPTDDRHRGFYLRHYSAEKAARRRGRSAITDPSLLRTVGPGEEMCLLTPDSRAAFTWRWAEYRADDESGVECALFRNEGTTIARSSDLIRAAVQLARRRWPGLRLFTFVNASRISSTNPGWCFIQAGWIRLSRRSKSGLRILEAPDA